MRITKRDSVFVVLIVGILSILFFGMGKKLGKDVPATPDHLDFYQQLEEGGSRIELEKGCVFCHESQSLPNAHPHKEECMVCHQCK